ncbi:MAG: potassium channel family protein [Myxococcota bacterium]
MKNPKLDSKYIIVIGCGRLGSYLASYLSANGNSVVVIDKNENSFNDLSVDFSGFKIDGDATQLSVLKKAKMKNADILIATTLEDNINLMVAQVAKKVFHVPKVLARVFDPKREEVYAQLGISTISPTSVAAEIFIDEVNKPNTQDGTEQ